MKHKDLAAAYGLSIETVRRWPAEKRAALIREIESGVNHEVKRLIGELAQLCYVCECRDIIEADDVIMEIQEFSRGSSKNLNALALQGAISKLEEFLK